MIPVSEPNLDVKDAAAVVEAVRTTQISGNSAFVGQFEATFANYIGRSFGVAVNSGASALHLALLSLGIGKGDEVLVPDLTMIATANAVTYTGAKPVFVDSEEATWCVDPQKLGEEMSSKTKAIVPVHLYGHSADMESILQIVNPHGLFGLPVIEDAAEAIGSEYKGAKCGSFGDAACFSFYANKNITTGEGGMIVTDNKEIADKCRSLRGHCFGEGLQHFNHTGLGFSYRLSGLQAALGLSQMDRKGELIERKCLNGKFYNQFLKPLADEGKITLPPQMPWAKNTYWYYTILVNPEYGVSRDGLMQKLWEAGIETRPAFVPMHKQVIYRQKGEFPVADMVSDRGINLPSSSRLKPEEVMFVCDKIKEFAG